MLEELRTIAIVTAVAGGAISALGIVALIASLRNAVHRSLALGWTYVGMSVMATAGGLVGLLGLARSGDTAALAIGLPPIALVVFISFRLTKAAGRAFRQAALAEKADELAPRR